MCVNCLVLCSIAHVQWLNECIQKFFDSFLKYLLYVEQINDTRRSLDLYAIYMKIYMEFLYQYSVLVIFFLSLSFSWYISSSKSVDSIRLLSCCSSFVCVHSQRTKLSGMLVCLSCNVVAKTSSNIAKRDWNQLKVRIKYISLSVCVRNSTEIFMEIITKVKVTTWTTNYKTITIKTTTGSIQTTVERPVHTLSAWAAHNVQASTFYHIYNFPHIFEFGWK